MPRKLAHEKPDTDDDVDMGDFDDEEPIPARRDTRIFHRDKGKEDKDEDFEEDVFV
jgi:hypothetical protein